MQSTYSDCKNKKSRFVKNKMQKALEKELNCKFIRINTRRKSYNADYEASRIHTNKIKELEDEIKKLKLQLANSSVQNNYDNDNDNDNDNDK